MWARVYPTEKRLGLIDNCTGRPPRIQSSFCLSEDEFAFHAFDERGPASRSPYYHPCDHRPQDHRCLQFLWKSNCWPFSLNNYNGRLRSRPRAFAPRLLARFDASLAVFVSSRLRDFEDELQDGNLLGVSQNRSLGEEVTGQVAFSGSLLAPVFHSAPISPL